MWVTSVIFNSNWSMTIIVCSYPQFKAGTFGHTSATTAEEVCQVLRQDLRTSHTTVIDEQTEHSSQVSGI